jgi:dTDP-glucose 4,6-dehydratase
LTYAGNPENLQAVADHPGYKFVQGDICDAGIVNDLAPGMDAVVNFAAETHVDRSILEPGGFIRTDVYGTYTLLEAVKSNKVPRYLQISTDEVYGSIEQGAFTEESPLRPSSPYSASKAGGDMLVYSYFVTYRLPAIITRSSNNFGPYQYPEKLIPLFITNALEDKPLPLYGDGRNVRDWIYVEDNCEAIDKVLRSGKEGEIYNIGGGNERTNVEITERILRELGKPKSLIQPVKDRAGHDRRYAVDCSKVGALGFAPKRTFDEAIGLTVGWYRENAVWWQRIKSGDFREYYQKVYGKASPGPG